jgi:hypothetical protein
MFGVVGVWLLLCRFVEEDVVNLGSV